MWLPSFRSLVFGRRLPASLKKREFYLAKIAHHFSFDKTYSSFELNHIIQTSHIVNVREVRQALLDHGFLEEDLYVRKHFRRIK